MRQLGRCRTSALSTNKKWIITQHGSAVLLWKVNSDSIQPLKLLKNTPSKFDLLGFVPESELIYIINSSREMFYLHDFSDDETHSLKSDHRTYVSGSHVTFFNYLHTNHPRLPRTSLLLTDINWGQSPHFILAQYGSRQAIYRLDLVKMKIHLSWVFQETHLMNPFEGSFGLLSKYHLSFAEDPRHFRVKGFGCFASEVRDQTRVALFETESGEKVASFQVRTGTEYHASFQTKQGRFVLFGKDLEEDGHPYHFYFVDLLTPSHRKIWEDLNLRKGDPTALKELLDLYHDQ